MSAQDSNPTIADMLSRRSIRSFQSRQIDEDALQTIIKAGQYAATGMGKQPTHLVVLQDPEQIATLSKMNAAVAGVDSDPFYGAPTVIVVLADAAASRTYVEDGSLVLGNLMLAAHALGIGSCWIHRARQEFDSPEGKALLAAWGVEGDWVGIGHCVLGYAAGDAPQPAPRKPGFVTRV
ncbi:MAG: nitroreductase [Coriobacteriia bacterium]|nr:nitroreductase [Coriobacteriia bacterium]